MDNDITYAMVWEGRTEGTVGGHNDGWPETKIKIIKTLDSLVANAKENHNAVFYRMIPIDVKPLITVIDDFNKDIKSIASFKTNNTAGNNNVKSDNDLTNEINKMLE